MYELAVYIKILQLTYSTSHSSGKSVQKVYSLQQRGKLTYN